MKKTRGCSPAACIRAFLLSGQAFRQLIPQLLSAAAGGHREHWDLPSQAVHRRLLQAPFAVFLMAEPARVRPARPSGLYRQRRKLFQRLLRLRTGPAPDPPGPKPAAPAGSRKQNHQLFFGRMYLQFAENEPGMPAVHGPPGRATAASCPAAAAHCFDSDALPEPAAASAPPRPAHLAEADPPVG